MPKNYTCLINLKKLLSGKRQARISFYSFLFARTYRERKKISPVVVHLIAKLLINKITDLI